MHSLGGGVAGQGGRVVVGQLLKVVRFIIGTIGWLFTWKYVVCCGFIFILYLSEGDSAGLRGQSF